MAKVILTAFNSRLRSLQGMDWPDDKIGQDIFLIMDMEKPSVYQPDEDMLGRKHDTRAVKARFEFSKKYEPEYDEEKGEWGKEYHAVYKLVDVEE